MYEIEIEIPCAEAKDLPRSMNNMIHEKKFFMWERSKWRRVIPKHVTKFPKEPLKRAKLTLTRHSMRRPDYDNLVASWKFIIDSLVSSGVLEGDSFKYIGDPEYLWEPAKQGEYKIKIKIEELQMDQKKVGA